MLALATVIVSACSALAPELAPVGLARREPFALYTHCGLDHTQLHRGEYWMVWGAEDGSGSAPDGLSNPKDQGTFVRDGDRGVYTSESGISLVLVQVPGRPADEVPCR